MVADLYTPHRKWCLFKRLWLLGLERGCWRIYANGRGFIRYAENGACLNSLWLLDWNADAGGFVMWRYGEKLFLSAWKRRMHKKSTISDNGAFVFIIAVLFFRKSF